MKKHNHSLSEPAAERGYKKRYLVRKLEEQEAKEEIKEYIPPEEPTWDNEEPIPRM